MRLKWSVRSKRLATAALYPLIMICKIPKTYQKLVNDTPAGWEPQFEKSYTILHFSVTY